jgi:enterochelin esterase-like enzyme
MGRLEVSDPRFERGGVRHVTVKSPALRGRGDLTLYVPPGRGPMPIAILLHGIYSSHWAWVARGGVHRTAARLIRRRAIRPMVLAMPSDGLWGDGSGYVRHDGRDFERWIVHDVVEATCRVVPSAARRGRLFIAGLSMGGHGALRLGAKYPDRFAAACGLSSVTNLRQLAANIEEDWRAWGVPEHEASLRQFLLRRRRRLPAIRFDCGRDDPLIAANRRLHEALATAKIPHVYEEFPGAHDWAYWERHVADALKFFDRVRG